MSKVATKLKNSYANWNWTKMMNPHTWALLCAASSLISSSLSWACNAHLLDTQAQLWISLTSEKERTIGTEISGNSSISCIKTKTQVIRTISWYFYTISFTTPLNPGSKWPKIGWYCLASKWDKLIARLFQWDKATYEALKLTGSLLELREAQNATQEELMKEGMGYWQLTLRLRHQPYGPFWSGMACAWEGFRSSMAMMEINILINASTAIHLRMIKWSLSSLLSPFVAINQL